MQTFQSVFMNGEKKMRHWRHHKHRNLDNQRERRHKYKQMFWPVFILRQKEKILETSQAHDLRDPIFLSIHILDLGMMGLLPFLFLTASAFQTIPENWHVPSLWDLIDPQRCTGWPPEPYWLTPRAVLVDKMKPTTAGDMNPDHCHDRLAHLTR